MQATTRLTWRAARSMASWPMWEEENEETRSSTERLMLGWASPWGHVYINNLSLDSGPASIRQIPSSHTNTRLEYPSTFANHLIKVHAETSKTDTADKAWKINTAIAAVPEGLHQLRSSPAWTVVTPSWFSVILLLLKYTRIGSVFSPVYLYRPCATDCDHVISGLVYISETILLLYLSTGVRTKLCLV